MWFGLAQNLKRCVGSICGREGITRAKPCQWCILHGYSCPVHLCPALWRLLSYHGCTTLKLTFCENIACEQPTNNNMSPNMTILRKKKHSKRCGWFGGFYNLPDPNSAKNMLMMLA